MTTNTPSLSGYEQLQDDNEDNHDNCDVDSETDLNACDSFEGDMLGGTVTVGILLVSKYRIAVGIFHGDEKVPSKRMCCLCGSVAYHRPIKIAAGISSVMNEHAFEMMEDSGDHILWLDSIPTASSTPWPGYDSDVYRGNLSPSDGGLGAGDYVVPAFRRSKNTNEDLEVNNWDTLLELWSHALFVGANDHRESTDTKRSGILGIPRNIEVRVVVSLPDQMPKEDVVRAANLILDDLGAASVLLIPTRVGREHLQANSSVPFQINDREDKKVATVAASSSTVARDVESATATTSRAEDADGGELNGLWNTACKLAMAATSEGGLQWVTAETYSTSDDEERKRATAVWNSWQAALEQGTHIE